MQKGFLMRGFVLGIIMLFIITSIQLDTCKIVHANSTITFYTNPSSVGGIGFNYVAYSNGDSSTIPEGTYLIEAIEPSGYYFSHWTSTGGLIITNQYSDRTYVSLSNSCTLTAWFTPFGENMITLYEEALDNGNIIFNGTQYCNIGEDGKNIGVDTGIYPIDAAPDPRQLFSNWTKTGSLSVANPNSQSTTVTVTGPGTLSVWFDHPRAKWSPQNIDFGTLPQGGTGNQTIEIWNEGIGTLSYTFIENIDWLTIYPTNGSSTGEHNLHTITVANTTGMAGSYDENIELWYDNNGDPIGISLTISIPPNQPSKPNGPATGVTGVQYQYTTSATDPDSGDQIKYGWDWNGDKTVDEWSNLVNSGAMDTRFHIWSNTGNYNIQVMAEDEHGAQSSFSPVLTIVITTSTNKPPNVFINSPLSGATLSNLVTIQGTASDSDGTITQVEVCIDTQSWWIVSGTTSWSTEWNTTIITNGPHLINARSKDNIGEYSTIFSVNVIVNNTVDNLPPNKPSTPEGQTNGKIKNEYTYSSSAVDPDSDMVYLMFDWGEGNSSGWLGPFNSGTMHVASHNWTAKGSYNVKVKARDIYGHESVWSDLLPITMPYIFKPLWQQFFDWLLQRFPHAFPLLRQRIGC